MRAPIVLALFVLSLSTSVFAQDVKAMAVQARSRQPAVMLDHAQAAAVLRDTVILLGPDWAFLRKDGGNNCDPGATFRTSCDWVIHIPTNQGCDLFGDAPGYGADGKPVRGTMQPRGCSLEPAPGPWVPAGAAPVPQPQPQPQPSVDLGPILARLAALEAQHAALRKEFDAALNAPVVLPLDVLLKGLQSINFECAIGRSTFHGHGCTITPYAK